MWAKEFIIIALIVTAMIATVIGISLGLIVLGKLYGPPAMFGTLIAFFVLVACGGFSYQHAKEKLQKIESEEERTMDALKADHSLNDDDAMYKSLQKSINDMRQKMYPNSKKKTWV